MNKNFVSPRQCERCGGTGITPHARDMGRCFRCDGAGQIETDPATLMAKIHYLAGRKALGAAAFAYSPSAHWGLSKLEMESPERLAKAVASFLADDRRVLPALEAYGKGE